MTDREKYICDLAVRMLPTNWLQSCADNRALLEQYEKNPNLGKEGCEFLKETRDKLAAAISNEPVSVSFAIRAAKNIVDCVEGMK